MFGKPKPSQPQPNDTGAPEGQAAYIPIDDDLADFAAGGVGGTGEAGGASDPAEPTQADDLAKLRAELDEVDSRWKRACADFQNYQRRALQNEQEARRQGVTSVLNSLVPVLDHFDLALTQKPTDAASAGMLEGVKVIRGELLKALEAHGVRVINPTPNSPFDPNRHAALTHQPAEGVQPGHISSVFQPGYELFDRVIRPAKVAVAP